MIQLIGYQLVIGRQHADGNGQIKTRRLLLDIRRSVGNLNPEFVRAVETRSRDSFTGASGGPTAVQSRLFFSLGASGFVRGNLENRILVCKGPIRVICSEIK
jgi:hypothetical protein